MNGPTVRASPGPARRAVAVVSLALGLTAGLEAGPPFLTDDPEPVDLNHWEFYAFGMGDRTADADAVSAPAAEFNYGVAPNTQLHLIAPVASVSSPGSGWTSGYGDTELGIKYRFVQESDLRPQVGVFPLAELATGNGARGLGNGRTWFQLPVWAQKSWGPWTTYGGGGAVLNSAPGQRNHGFAGWLVQRDIGAHLTFGTELFQQGAATANGRGSTIANAGGYIKFTEKFNLLFSAGRSVAGERHSVWYLGFYWTGGSEKTPGK
ncbi:MAG TPA: hypothetical protein VKG78_10135 [Opitutaceae bacterium]|nr:hypothetical protein [Opitutaceae bacterium]